MSELTKENVISNMEAAADRMGLDLEDLQEMINEVLADCATKSKQLREAVINQDFDSVKTIAHDIKGSTANYGLQSPSAIALNIEKNNDSSTVEEVDQLIEQIDTLATLGLDKS